MSILKRVVRVRHLELKVIVGNCLKYDKVAVQRPFNLKKGLHATTYVCVLVFISILQTSV